MTRTHRGSNEKLQKGTRKTLQTKQLKPPEILQKITKQKKREHTNTIEKEITNSQGTDIVKNQPKQILTISHCKQCLKGNAGARGLPAEPYFKHCAAVQRSWLGKLRFEAREALKS